MNHKFLILLALVVSLGAQPAGTALPPLTSENRMAVVELIRERAESVRLWMELYDGSTASGPYQEGLMAGLQEAAKLVEEYSEQAPEPDPDAERHAQELIVINTLRVAFGLEPYEVYPNP